MKLIKQDEVGVWIKVESELPDKTAMYFIKSYNNQKDFIWYDDGQWFQWRHNERKIMFNPTHWLKPIKDVFVLIEDELKEITGDAMNYYCSSNEEKGLLPLNEQFIKEITKQ